MTTLTAPADIITDHEAAALLHGLALNYISATDARAAERAASGLALGDAVTVLVGGHSGEDGEITGVNFLGAWEVTICAMPYYYGSRCLRKLVTEGAAQ